MKPHSKMDPKMSTLFDKLFKTTQHNKQRFGMLYESFLKSKRRSKYQREENARIKSKSSLLDKSKFLYDIPDSMIFPNTAEKDETEENADMFLKEFGELLDKDYYLPESVLVQLGLSHLIESNNTDKQHNNLTLGYQKSTHTKPVSNIAFSKFPSCSSSNTGSRESSAKNTNQEILEKINSLKRKFNAQSGQPLQNGILSPKRKSASQDHSTSGNETNVPYYVKPVITKKTRIIPNLKNNLPSQNLSNKSEDDLEIVLCRNKTNCPLLKKKSNKETIKLVKKTIPRPGYIKQSNNLNKEPTMALQPSLSSGNALSSSVKSPAVPCLTGTSHPHDDAPSNDETNSNRVSSTSQVNMTPTVGHNKQKISQSKLITKTNSHGKNSKRRAKKATAKLKKREISEILEQLISKHIPSIVNSISQTQVPIQVNPQIPWAENSLSPMLNNLYQNGSLDPNNSEALNQSSPTILCQFRSLNSNEPTQVPLIITRNQGLETSQADSREDPLLPTIIKSEVDQTNVGYDLASTTPIVASDNHLNRNEIIASIVDSISSLTSDRQIQLDTLLDTEFENNQQNDLATNQEVENTFPSQNNNENNEDTNLSQHNTSLHTNTEGDSSAIGNRKPLIFLKSPSQLLKAPSTTSDFEEISTHSTQASKDGNSTGEKSPIQPHSSNDLETRENTPATSGPIVDPRPVSEKPVPPSFHTGLPETQRNGRSQHPRNGLEQHPKHQHTEALETQTRSPETHSSRRSEPTHDKEDHLSVLKKMLDFNAEMVNLLMEQKSQVEELMKEITSRDTTKACSSCTNVNKVLNDKTLTDDRKLIRLKIIQRNQRISQNN